MYRINRMESASPTCYGVGEADSILFILYILSKKIHLMVPMGL